MFGCWWSVRSVCLPSLLLFAVRVQRGREAELQEAHNTEGQWGVHAGRDCELWWESQTSMCHFNCVHFNSNHFMPLVFFIHVDTLVNLLCLYAIDITILSHLSHLSPCTPDSLQPTNQQTTWSSHSHTSTRIRVSPCHLSSVGDWTLLVTLNTFVGVVLAAQTYVQLIHVFSVASSESSSFSPSTSYSFPPEYSAAQRHPVSIQEYAVSIQYYS